MPADQNSSRRLVARALRMLGSVELAVASAAFLFTCTIVSANVLLRYGFNSSLVWSEEAALLSTNIFVFLGAATILKARADVSVTFVLRKLPVRVAVYLELLTYLAAAAFFATMLAQAILLWPLQRGTTTFILDISRFWFTLPLIWASASMLVTSLAFSMRAVASISRGHHDVLGAPYLAMPVEPE